MGDVIDIKSPKERFKKIEDLAVKYSNDYNHLAALEIDLKAELQKLSQKYSTPMNELTTSLSVTHAALYEEVMNNKDLFVKPKTKVFANIKVGLRKESDKIVVSDKDNTIKLIEKFYPDKSNILIKTEKSIVSGAIKTLTNEELTKIGCYKTTGIEQPVVGNLNNDLEKYIAALYAQEAA
jgi:hypothetical protein